MSTDRRDRLDAAAMSLMVLLCACWGVQQVAIKVANAGISPVLQAGIRSAGAAALLVAWSALRGVRLAERDGTLAPGILAGILFAGEFALIYWGLSYTAASRGVIFLYTAPFVVAAGAHLLLPGERLRPVQVAGLVCAFAGICLVFGEGLRLPTRRELIGDTMMFLAALLWGATTLVIKASALIRISPSKTLFYQLAVSAVTLPLVSAALGEPGVKSLDALVIASVAYQIVIVAFASYLSWFWLVKRYPAGRLSSFAFLTPLFGVLAGGWLLDEPLSAALLSALVLVGTGIYLVNHPPPAPPQ